MSEDTRLLVVGSGMGVSLLAVNPDEVYARACAIEDTDMQRAIELYGFATRIDKTHVTSWVNLGVCYHKLGKLQDAEECWMAALEQNPDHLEAPYNLACYHQESGSVEMADHLFERVLQLDATYADAYFNRAMVRERLGKIQESLTHWKNFLGLSTSPTNGVWLHMAERAVARLQKA